MLYSSADSLLVLPRVVAVILIVFVLCRNFQLLSFGEEAEEDEREVTQVSQVTNVSSCYVSDV